jgi:Domain of unknown function (DUF1772)
VKGPVVISRLSFVLGLFFPGILAGLFAMGTIVLQPASTRLPAEAQVLLRQQMIPILHFLAPPLMIGALVSSLVSAVAFASGWNRALSFLNSVLCAASLLITLFGNVPLNNQIMEWQANAPPGNWMDLIQKWSFYDQVSFLSALITAGFSRI